MADFYGHYHNSLDPKGRLAIPIKLRNALPEGQRNQLYITRGIEKCITGYSYKEYQRFLKQLDQLQINEKVKRQLKREFIGRTFETVFDKQGRITIPQELLKFAQLDGTSEAIVLGSGNVMEIWNAELYQAESEEIEDVIQSIMGEARLDTSEPASDSSES
jgi:MraZ protein